VASDSDQYVFRRACALEAARPQGLSEEPDETNLALFGVIDTGVGGSLYFAAGYGD